MNVLVFPCGSELGLEIHRSLVGKKGVTLFGLSSVKNDSGQYVYENYYNQCPFVNDMLFIDYVRGLVNLWEIDVIYPANDAALLKLKTHEHELCKVIGPSLKTVDICNSKLRTYETLKGVVNVPNLWPDKFPVFKKPDVGHSGIGCQVIQNSEQLAASITEGLIIEYLPGKEYTIDCFADQYAEGRERKKIGNGIATFTEVVEDTRFKEMAIEINSVLQFNCAWFFQVKENEAGDLVLMEVGARLAGSSSISRLRGVNLALLNLYDSEVRIKKETYIKSISRSLDVKAKINYEFENVYIDLDDTLIINGKANYKLLALIYKFRNDGKRIYLITRSTYEDTIYKLGSVSICELIFEFTIHVKPYEQKKDYMRPKSILIDDSFAEREDVDQPAFDTDVIDSLL